MCRIAIYAVDERCLTLLQRMQRTNAGGTPLRYFPLLLIALLLSFCSLASPSYATNAKLAFQGDAKPDQDAKPQEAKPDHQAQDEAKHAQDQQKNQMKDQQKNQERQAKQEQKQQQDAAKHQQDEARHQQEQQDRQQQADQAKHQQEEQQKQTKDAEKHQQEQARQAQKDQEHQQREQAKAQQDQERASQHDHDHNADHDHDNDHAHAREARRIPDRDFHEHFGHEHHFHVGHPVIVENRPRFQYSGYWFEFVDPWPADWSYDDDCYIDYVDDGYYLFDPVHPGMRIALTIVF